MLTEEKQIQEKERRSKLLHEDLTYKLIGLFFKIHTAIGCGFPERIYHKAIIVELIKERIGHLTEKLIKVKYDEKEVGTFRLDLIIEEKVIIEIKAVEYMPKIFKEQLLSYLKATEYEVGLLVNFGSAKLEYERIVPNESKNKINK